MMVISIWPSRPTMRERAPWIRRTEFPAFERRATTYRKSRMRTTGQVRGDLRRSRLIPGRYGRIRILPAALFLRTTKASRTTETIPSQLNENLGARKSALLADRCVRAAGKDKAEGRRALRDAETRDSDVTGENPGTIADARGLVLVPGVYSFHVTGTRF